MKPLSFTILITLLLLNSTVSFGQDTRILSRWREEAIVKDLIKGDICKIQVDSLKADTTDLRHVIKDYRSAQVKLNEVIYAKDKESWDWQQANVILKGEVEQQKKKNKLWIVIASIELILLIWIK